MTVAGVSVSSSLGARVTRAMTTLHEAHHARGEVTVDTYVGRDVVVCTFRPLAGAARLGGPLASQMGFPEGSGPELIAAVEGLTSRRVVAFLDADEADPAVAGQLFFLEPESSRCALSTEPLGGGAIVSVQGSLDRASVPDVEDEVQRQLHRRGGRLVLDLSGTTFIDASAIHLMDKLSARVAAAGGLFVVVMTCPRARWLLEVVPAREELQVVGTVEEAMAAWAGPDRRQVPASRSAPG